MTVEPGIEAPDLPSTARMIDCWLSGEHHHPVDIAAAHAFEGVFAPGFGHEPERRMIRVGKRLHHLHSGTSQIGSSGVDSLFMTV